MNHSVALLWYEVLSCLNVYNYTSNQR